VDGNLTSSGNSATWVFDALGTNDADLVTVGGNLDVSGFTLDLAGVSASALASNAPIPIATYGSLSGGQFGGLSNVPAGRFIDYNFNGTNTVALVVPEATHFAPLLGALVPLLGLRRRRK
jgi:hypothetical protein